jgi:transcriptional regulator with XRE-family HTH domain
MANKSTPKPRGFDDRSRFSEELASRIKQVMQRKSLDYRTAAERSGGLFSAAMLQKYVEFGMEMRASRLVALCVVLEVPLTDLLPPPASSCIVSPTQSSARSTVQKSSYFKGPKEQKKK